MPSRTPLLGCAGTRTIALPHSRTPPMSTALNRWMSWEGGVDLVAATAPELALPNVIIHLARLVHTPVGSAPSGMVLFQPDPAVAPLVMGFVSTDPKVGAYFGPKIFAGTPFAAAPVLDATIEIEVGTHYVAATVAVSGHVFQTHLGKLSPFGLVQRAPGGMTPFHQQGLEATAGHAQLWVDGRAVPIFLPPVGLSGGPAAVYAPAGLYAR
jgi:hypothetical protein